MNDNYLTYDATALAADDRFIRWVRDGQDREQWESWLQRHPEREETVAEARRLVERIRFDRPAGATDREALWSRIRTSVREAETAPPRRRAVLFYLGAAAAAASVALLIFWGLSSLNTRSVETGRSDHLAYTLPDQSQVTLNAESSLRFQKKGWPGQRRLSLQGEAFFEVEEGGSFVVQTPLGKVTVLGTAFNVFSRGEQFTVRCTAGRVRVNTPRDEAGVTLAPGEVCRLAPGGLLTKESFDLDLGVGWLRGVFRFEKQPLDVVLAELERQFDVRIEAPDTVRRRVYSGAFSGEDLDAALRDVCWPLNLKPEQKGKTIYIRPESSE